HTMFKRRGNGACAPNSMCDIMMRQRPDRIIGFVCDHIVNFERHFGQEYNDLVRESCMDAVEKFGPSTAFKNDERMLPVYRILSRYSKSMTATELYKNLHEKSMFTSSIQFHMDWTEAHLHARDYPAAAETIHKAVATFGTKHPGLVDLKNFVDRVLAQQAAAENYSYPPPPYVPLPAAFASPARSLDFGELISRPPPTLPHHQQQQLKRSPSTPPTADTSVAARRALGPIQPPLQGAAAVAAAAAASVIGPSAVHRKDFSPLKPSAASSSSSAYAAAAEAAPQQEQVEESDDSNDENQENVEPRRLSRSDSIVLPQILGPEPIDPATLSPCAVFTFADMARESENA
ncbi:hypothetical protein PMAYCL1PPCAC_05079, partial [Pristionchus mayeri]